MPLNIITNKIISPNYKNSKSEVSKDYVEPNIVDINPIIQTKLGQFRENYYYKFVVDFCVEIWELLNENLKIIL
jgi:hypothetical protein